MANKVEVFLHGKTAGLPNSVWVVIIGGAVGVGWWVRRKNKNATVSADTGIGVASDGSTSFGGQAPSQFINVTPGALPVPIPPEKKGYVSNNEWFQSGVQYYVDHPTELPKTLTLATLQEALNAYLQGQPTSLWQRGTSDMVITKIGPPPAMPGFGGALFEPAGNYGPGSPAVGNLIPGQSVFGTIGGKYWNPGDNQYAAVVAGQTKANIAKGWAIANGIQGSGPAGSGVGVGAGTAPAAPAPVYTVIGSESLDQVADLYGVSWQTIYNANRHLIKNPQLLQTGMQLHIPGLS